MSVFADTQWSGFDSNPFGWDSVRNSSPFRGFGFGSGRGLFEDDRDRSDNDTLASTMRYGSTGPTLTERGFYDHFDNIFHDLSHGGRRRYDTATAAEESRRQSAGSGKGREYVIPIKIERSTVSSSSASSKSESRIPRSDTTKSSSSSSVNRGAIEIPIIRENTSQQKNARSTQESRYSAPSHFRLLTPTIEDRRSNPRVASKDEDVVYMDSDDFFPSKASNLSDDVRVIEVEEEETLTSRRRKSQRYSPDDVSSTSNKSATSSRTASVGGTASSPKSFTSSSNIRQAGNVTIIDVKNQEKKWESEREQLTAGSEERRKVPCSSAGNIDVTPAPGYPIYDLLKPRLASIDRQLDYIRGDGNCFFRALSKEMYGSENFHAEWRQAVVDVIESHPHVFRQYIDGENVACHVRDMRKAGTWATSCEIYAAATLLQREIYVLAPSPNHHEYNWLLFSPRPLPGAPSAPSGSSASFISSSSSSGQATDVHPCYLTLCYTNGNHYDRITPVFANCNCEIPPPSLNGMSVLVDLSDDEDEDRTNKR